MKSVLVLCVLAAAAVGVLADETNGPRVTDQVSANKNSMLVCVCAVGCSQIGCR